MSIATIPGLLTGIAATLRQAMPDLDVRVQLDPFDVDGLIANESFRDIAARVVFATATPVRRAGGGYDLDVGCGVFLAAGRQGRADPTRASADLACMDRALQAYRALAADPYVGLGKLAEIQLLPLRVLTSERSNEKGIALVAIELATTLYDALDPRAAVSLLTDPIAHAWTQFSINGGAVQQVPQ
jgi:hypothetical protein